MRVTLVARLGYCNTHGVRTVTGRRCSSPYRPLSMASGGISRGNPPPNTGWTRWHHGPAPTNMGGLQDQHTDTHTPHAHNYNMMYCE